MGALKFDTSENTGYFLIQFPDLSRRDSARDFEVECKQWLLVENPVHVFDFKRVFKLDQTLLVQLLGHIKNLKAQNKKVHSINLSKDLFAEFKERGLIASLAPLSSIDDLQVKASKAPQKIDVAYVKPFVEGATKAFEIQVKMSLKIGKIFAKQSRYESTDAVCGIVTVDVEKFRGSITLCMGTAVFVEIYKALVGEEIKSVDKDSADAAGELMNIIYGHAKTVLNNEFGLELKPLIPMVVLSPPVESVKGTVIVIPFETPFGGLRMEIFAN